MFLFLETIENPVVLTNNKYDARLKKAVPDADEIVLLYVEESVQTYSMLSPLVTRSLLLNWITAAS